jgi:four helix bundle protein
MARSGFQDLDIYKRTVLLRRKIFQLAQSFPPDEKFRMTDQVIRSTRKCPANIAEGYGRFHYQENIQFCRIARGSLCETLDHLSCAFECGYITEDQLSQLEDEIGAILKMLNGYINYLKSRKSEG